LKLTFFSTLNKVYISGFSTSWGERRGKESSQPPSESISLNFAGIEFGYYDAAGLPLAATHYHLAANVATLKAGPELKEIAKYKKEPKKKEDGKTEDD
jgi:hypothetical protein